MFFTPEDYRHDTNERGYQFQQLENPNRVTVFLHAESGLNPKSGEYDAWLVAFEQAINLLDGELDDINEAIEEAVEGMEAQITLPPDMNVEAVFVESGEWEGWQWLRYYVLESWRVISDEEEEGQ